MISRREFAKNILAMSTAGFLSPLAACEDDGNDFIKTSSYSSGMAVTPLKKLGALAGVKFGSAFDMESVSDPAYADLLKYHCNILTTDNQFKFWALRPKEDLVNFSRSDLIMDFAYKSAIPVRGHTLIWNEWNPPWLNNLSSDRTRYWFERHIDEVVGRYAGRIHSWDVVNEPIWPGHKKELGLRNGAWLQAMGADYVKRAFELTAKADPSAKRVLNEAWLERGDHWGAELRKFFLPFVDRLLQEGTLIDAIGLQCHLAPGNMALDEFIAIVEQLKSWNLEVYVTELDVNDKSFSDDIFSRDYLVAKVYHDFLRELLRTGAISIVQTWQLSDKYSFYQAKQKRKVRVLPFDSCMRKKPAYESIASAFYEARKK